MKQVLLLSISILLATVSNAQEAVDNTTHTLISKRTASWCSNCGSYGWDLFEGLLEDSEGVPEAIAVAVHSSGDYQNAVSNLFVRYVGGAGQPLFFANSQDMLVNRNNIAAKRVEIMSQVTANAAVDAPVGLSSTAILDGTALTVDTDYAITAGTDYKVGVYLLYNNLIGPQSARGSNANHKRMLQEFFLTEEIEGDAITGTEGSHSVTVDIADLGTHPIEDMQILVVVWTGTGNSIDYINGRLLDITSATVDAADITIEDLKVISLDASIEASWSGTEVSTAMLVSVTGQVVATTAVNGSKSVRLTAEHGGLYVLVLDTPQGRHSQQVVLR